VADSFVRQKRVVAGYFFKRGEQGRNDTNRIFSTLAMQLADGIPSFRASLGASLASFDSDAMEKKELNFQFDKLFRTPLSCLSPINMSHLPAVIIIDALDECNRPEHLPLILTLLLEVCNTTTMNLHLRVLFTSRSAPSILDAFRPHKAVRKLLFHQEFSADNKSDIRTFLKAKFDDIRTKCNVQQDPWPIVEDLDRLVELATTPEPLFIYAATLCRFVYDEKRPRNPKNQLKLWLNQGERNKSQLHQIYDPILSRVLLDHEGAEFEQQLQFLGALVLLAEPLSATSLASLLDMDMDNVNWWLLELHAVLDIPTEPHKPLLPLHKSFSDFLLLDESARHVKYGVDAERMHALLAARCIQLMTVKLKRDICEIRRLEATLDEVNSKTINRCIPPELQYACMHWAYHLQASGEPLDHHVCDFLFEHFLHWLEALSLIGRLADGADALIVLTKLIKVCGLILMAYRLTYNYRHLPLCHQKFSLLRKMPLELYRGSG
jgi:hypothetical protein